eukprot:Rhum_TRINITY_DN12864_c0_g2::Rhum_TRINITY_DN12864_c0_g2_i1::g.54991::m.54991
MAASARTRGSGRLSRGIPDAAGRGDRRPRVAASAGGACGQRHVAVAAWSPRERRGAAAAEGCVAVACGVPGRRRPGRAGRPGAVPAADGPLPARVRRRHRGERRQPPRALPHAAAAEGPAVVSAGPASPARRCSRRRLCLLLPTGCRCRRRRRPAVAAAPVASAACAAPRGSVAVRRRRWRRARAAAAGGPDALRRCGAVGGPRRPGGDSRAADDVPRRRLQLRAGGRAAVGGVRGGGRRRRARRRAGRGRAVPALQRGGCGGRRLCGGADGRVRAADGAVGGRCAVCAGKAGTVGGWRQRLLAVGIALVVPYCSLHILPPSPRST